MRYLFLIAIIVLAGCSSKTAPSQTELVKDSTVVKYVPRVDTVRLPGEKVTLTEYIECDEVTRKPKPINTERRKGRALVKVKIDTQGKLTATGGCDSLKQVVELMDKEIFRLRHEKKTEVSIVKEYINHWYDPPARIIALVTILFTAGYVIVKIKTLNPL